MVLSNTIVSLLLLLSCLYSSSLTGISSVLEVIYRRSQEVKLSTKGKFVAELPKQTRECNIGKTLRPNQQLSDESIESSRTKNELSCSDMNPETKIIKDYINLDARESVESQFTMRLRNVLTRNECNFIITSRDPDPESISPDESSGIEIKHFANKDFANLLWGRISSYVPPTAHGHKVLGLHFKFMFNRVGPTGVVHFHTDRYKIVKDFSEFTLYTVLLYLNDDKGSNLNGGDLLLFDKTNSSVLVPLEAGNIIIFPAKTNHTATKVSNGLKYFLRNDIWVQNKFHSCN